MNSLTVVCSGHTVHSDVMLVLTGFSRLTVQVWRLETSTLTTTASPKVSYSQAYTALVMVFLLISFSTETNREDGGEYNPDHFDSEHRTTNPGHIH